MKLEKYADNLQKYLRVLCDRKTSKNKKKDL